MIMAVWGRAHSLSVMDAPHNNESLPVSGEETICFLKLECQREERTRDLRNSKQADLTTLLTTAPCAPCYVPYWLN